MKPFRMVNFGEILLTSAVFYRAYFGSFVKLVLLGCFSESGQLAENAFCSGL
jgi:hypothetical protein